MAKEIMDVASMSDADLKAELQSLEANLLQMKFDHAAKGLGNPMELREMRRAVARIYTEARSRELATLDPAALESRSKLRARRSRQK
jgi:ribosomal protein L29